MKAWKPTAVLVALLFTAAGAWSDTVDLYKAQTGPYPTAVATPVDITIPERNRDLILRISYPTSTGVFPLIVFFHGALCSGDGYAALADHWASHGYVVILPSHSGSGRRGSVDSDQRNKIFREQVADMSSILDSLDAIEARVEPLRNAVDSTRVAAAGHSMGALIATIVSGLTRLESDGSHLSLRDDRYDVAVLLSGPGPLPLTPEDAWESVTVPTLVTTGTRDHANRGGEGATWEWRLGAFRLTPPGDKYGLVIDQADHFLGGLICTERAEGSPDDEAFAIVKSISTAFLDVYLKQDATARTYLNESSVSDATNGRATLLSR
jgi:predicted dienelactone hydrolase